MKKLNLLFIIGLIFVCSFNSVSAVDWDTDVEMFLPLFNTIGSANGKLDISSNGRFGTQSGGAGFNANETAFFFDGLNDNILLVNNFSSVIDGTNNFSVSIWFNSTDSTADQTLISFQGERRIFVDYGITDNKVRFFYNDGASTTIISSNDVSDSIWNNVIIMYDEVNGGSLYINGVLRGSDSNVGNLALQTKDSAIAFLESATPRWFEGEIASAIVFNKILNSSDISGIQSNGKNYNPYIIPPPPINQSMHYESAFITQQLGLTTLTSSGVNYTILSDSFFSNVSYPFYGDVTVQMFSNSGTYVTCYIQSAGNVIAESSRNNLANSFGSLAFGTSVINTSIGGNPLDLVCNKIGGSNVAISLTNGIAHLSTNNVTYYIDTIGNSSLTISNESLRTDTILVPYNGTAVVEWDNSIFNNGVNQLVSTQLITSGGSCGIFDRTISSGNSGSTGGGCAFPVTYGSNFSAGLYVTGSNININHTPKLKFIDSPVNYSRVYPDVIGSTPTLITNLTLNNSENFDKVFIRTGLSLDDTNKLFSIYYSVNGINSSIIPKTASSNTEVLISQDLLTSPSGIINVSLYGYSNSGLVNINGGDFLIYLTEEYPTNDSFFNVTAYDIFDNSSIQNFSVSYEGLILNSTNGLVQVFTNELTLDLIVSSSLYFSTNYYNHNTTLDLFAYLNQTNINWNCLEKVTNNNLECSSPNESQIFNYNLFGNPHTQSLNVTGYYERLITFNVSALQSETKLATGFYSTNLTLNSNSSYGVIGNCSYTIEGITYPSYSEIVDGSPLSSVGLINGTYNVTATCIGFSIDSSLIIINESVQYLNFTLFTENSILFKIYDLNSGLLINSQIDIELLGSTITYNSGTSNGTLYLDGLNDDTYKITLNGSTYSPTILFATISNSNHLDINVYMKAGTEIDFIVQDERRVLLGNATLTFTQIINGSEITIGQAKTDFSGRASIFLDETIEYKLFVKRDGYNTFTGQVIPTQSEYTIIMSKIGASRFISIFEDLVYSTTFDYNPYNTFAIAQYILNSPDGALSYYGMSSTYNGVTYFVNTSGIPAGGIETFNFTNIDSINEPILIIDYWFKYNGHALVEWSTTYLVSDLVPSNVSITNGLFEDLSDLDSTNPIKGIMGAFIIISLVLIFSFSKNLTATTLGGIIGLAINWKFELMPKELLTVAMIVAFILIVADNIGGGR